MKDFFGIFKSWWLLVFVVIAFIGFERLSSRKNKEIHEYRSSIFSLHKKKEDLFKKHQDLIFQKKSQREPYWIEMVLMKKLGVVPEGKIKVVFIEK